jgi:hypothetical protein
MVKGKSRPQIIKIAESLHGDYRKLEEEEYENLGLSTRVHEST